MNKKLSFKDWNDTWALAIVFGLISIPWTYLFVAVLYIPLWPSFIASATVYAAGGGIQGLVRGYASNLSGILYATATLFIVNVYFGGGVIALSVVVGVFMFLVNIHKFIPVLSFTPGAFLGYATMFGIHAISGSYFGLSGLTAEMIAAIVAMFFGACIGIFAVKISNSIHY